MKNVHHFFSIGVIAFAVSMALVACEGSSSVIYDEEPVPSAILESSAIPESSESAPESSASVPTLECIVEREGWHESVWESIFRKEYVCRNGVWEEWDSIIQPPTYPTKPREECNAENEGAVARLTTGFGNPKNGYSVDFYRCEQGVWVESPAWVACDTAGVTVGDVCKKQISSRGSLFGVDTWFCYKYAGEGVWESSSCPTEPEKECVNNDAKEEIVLTNDTLFFKCSGRKWREISVGEYYCSTGNEVFGDTCSFERFGEKQYFRYDNVDSDIGMWTEAAFDPEMGFCTENDANYWARAYAKKGDEYYYCSGTAWVATNLVPRQETDPRKEGLTDEEYDMLDLPKDAKVGDRASGLLEYCEHNKTLGFDYPNVYDYCFSPNHYRYRGDGKWSRETIEDIHADDIDLDSLPCGGSTWCCTETEGMKQRANGYYFDEPEVIYQCISGETVLVERLWNRYEKK